MNLVIVHYHFRPGGIRRVIELATPFILKRLRSSKLLLVTGEAPEPHWIRHFRRRTAPVPVAVVVEPALSYVSEQRLPPGRIEEAIRTRLEGLLDGIGGSGTLVWAHNLGIARNLLLTRQLMSSCAERHLPLIAHHHDWWFENRWLRWPEMQRCGFRTLASTARVLFPADSGIRHVTINQSDAGLLRRYLPDTSFWLPNLVERTKALGKKRVREARAWLSKTLHCGDAPVWIVPCRLLRRKNLAEAILLTRWLRPEAWLVSTAGESSADELEYRRRLEQAIHRYSWRVRLAVLHDKERRSPTVSELIEASETILLTSLQEGFGLPYLEASAASKPLIARALPNIAPDLELLGFRFPQLYLEILVSTDLFDAAAERKRQKRLFHDWRQKLPKVCQQWVGKPVFLPQHLTGAVPFSRLTLTAQLEVLSQPISKSWDACSRMNPFLVTWKKNALNGRLQSTRWPAKAERWLSGPAYANQFAAIVSAQVSEDSRPNSAAIQEGFLRERLSTEHLFPVLWHR